MSKPFMCGDEFPIYVPSGGCDCNYTLRRIDTDEYQSSYELVLNGTGIGDVINIPKDNYVDTCVLQTVMTPEVPYTGAKVGDYYLDISFVHESRHIYVPLAAIMGGGYLIVDSLPEEGDSRYIYLVDDGQGGYERYVWDAENNDWISLGSTEIDLSNYYTKTEVDGMIQNIMLNFYPIGSMYMSVNSTDPGTLFGGTWVRIKDTFLLASGNTYPADDGTHTTSTNGSPDAVVPYHRHSVGALTSGGMSANVTHDHMLSAEPDKIAQGTYYQRTRAYGVTSNTFNTSSANLEHTHTIGAHNTNYEGVSVTGANMPPYLPVYVWKRTA